MMDYVASLENRVENLNLYLNFVQENLPLMFADMMRHFSGMPGYVHAEKEG